MAMQTAATRFNPHVSVDCVIFGFDGKEIKVLLIEREQDGDVSAFALPGDLIRDDEGLDAAATRILKQLASLEDIYMEQFSAFGDPRRMDNSRDKQWLKVMREDPDARVITVAYYSLIRLEGFSPKASSFAKNVGWYPVDSTMELAFDHNEIIEKALEKLRSQLRHEPIGFELLPEKFTLSQLQSLYEAILGGDLDKRNFRKKFLSKKILIPLKEKETGVPHKPARYYAFNKERYDTLKSNPFGFSI